MTEAEALRTLQTIRYSPPIARQRKQLPAIQEIAREAGVSLSTIYNMLRERQVSVPVRNRILAAVQTVSREYEYQVVRAPTPAKPAETPKTSEPIVKYVRFR